VRDSAKQKFSHPSLVIYFSATPPIKLKLGLQIGGADWYRSIIFYNAVWHLFFFSFFWFFLFCPFFALRFHRLLYPPAFLASGLWNLPPAPPISLSLSFLLLFNDFSSLSCCCCLSSSSSLSLSFSLYSSSYHHLLIEFIFLSWNKKLRFWFLRRGSKLLRDFSMMMLPVEFWSPERKRKPPIQGAFSCSEVLPCFVLLQTLSFRPALQSSFSCLWFVVVILVLIHDCDVCSFFVLFIFPISSSISLHYRVHFSLLALFLCYPLLFISVSLSFYFAFVLFCSVSSSRFVTQQEGKGAGIL